MTTTVKKEKTLPKYAKFIIEKCELDQSIINEQEIFALNKAIEEDKLEIVKSIFSGRSCLTTNPSPFFDLSEKVFVGTCITIISFSNWLFKTMYQSFSRIVICGLIQKIDLFFCLLE